jgi:hydroxymethylpyrimidine/phosphomethylpyrimidine kinase
MTATTALTAQNTLGVQDIHHIPPRFLQKQIDAVCDDVGVDVVKTGIVCSILFTLHQLIVNRYAGISRIS